MIMKKLVGYLAVVLFLVLCVPVSAQNISVESASGDSIANFINKYLTGQGVYLFNFKYNNKENTFGTDQIGTFQSNGYEGLQMDSGVLMTTGKVKLAPGPNNSNSATDGLSSYYSDNVMNTYSTNNVTACSTLDFDFISISPYVSVNYCFGSEEYPEYVCSTVNDVFGFIITGPDPVTNVEKTWNAAIIPYTVSTTKPNGIAVAINSVNKGSSTNSGGTGCYWTYSDFYVANHTTSDAPNNKSGVQYDGYTQKLSANAKLLPCTKYHMHISICNVGDNAYDSGVFLEYGSFNSPSADVNLSHRYADTLERSKSITLPLTLAGSDYDVAHVSVSFGGTANIVQDYTVTTDSGVNLSTINTTFNLDQKPHSLTFKGTATADLHEPKLIELYLKSSLCEDYPELKSYDTIRYILVEDDLVRLRHDTIVAYDTCHQVGVEVAVGHPTVFHWMPEDGIDFPHQQYSSALITESTLYKVAAADDRGHTDTTEVYVEIRPKEGIDEVEQQNEPVVYPNPTKGPIHVQADDVVRVQVYDIDGVKVFESQYYDAPQLVIIDNLPVGVYAVRITTSTGIHVEKAVVH